MRLETINHPKRPKHQTVPQAITDLKTYILALVMILTVFPLDPAIAAASQSTGQKARQHKKTDPPPPLSIEKKTYGANDYQIMISNIINDGNSDPIQKKARISFELEYIWKNHRNAYLSCVEIVSDFLKDDGKSMKPHIETIAEERPFDILENYHYLRSLPWSKKIYENAINTVWTKTPDRIFSRMDGEAWKMIIQVFPGKYDEAMRTYFGRLMQEDMNWSTAQTMLDVAPLIVQLFGKEQASGMLLAAAENFPLRAFDELPSTINRPMCIFILGKIADKVPAKAVTSLFGTPGLNSRPDMEILRILERIIQKCAEEQPEIFLQHYHGIRKIFHEQFQQLFLKTVTTSDPGKVVTNIAQTGQLVEDADVLNKTPNGRELLKRIATVNPHATLLKLDERPDLYFDILKLAAEKEPGQALTALSPRQTAYDSLTAGAKEQIRRLWQETLERCIKDEPGTIINVWTTVIRPNLTQDAALQIGRTAIDNMLKADIFYFLRPGISNEITNILGEEGVRDIFEQSLPKIIRNDPYRLIDSHTRVKEILRDEHAVNQVITQAVNALLERDPGKMLEKFSNICAILKKTPAPEDACKELLGTILHQARHKDKISILRHVNLLYFLFGNDEQAYTKKLLPYVTEILEEEPDIILTNNPVEQQTMKRILNDVYIKTKNQKLKTNLGKILGKTDTSF